MEQLEGRVAVVTGAASGIGFAIAEALTEAGTNVLITDVDPSGLDAAAERLDGRGGEVDRRIVDVRKQASVERAAAHAVRRFGALHIAVNNAGVVNGGLSWQLSVAEWKQVLDVNLWGVIHGIRAFVPRIIASGVGHVVNTASVAAVVPHQGVGPYTASKHAVLGLTDVLRAELAATGLPIGASTLLPGMTRTTMNPIGTVEPSVVAANVIDAIRHDRPYVFTDDYAVDDFDARMAALQAARREVRR